MRVTAVAALLHAQIEARAVCAMSGEEHHLRIMFNLPRQFIAAENFLRESSFVSIVSVIVFVSFHTYTRFGSVLKVTNPHHFPYCVNGLELLENLLSQTTLLAKPQVAVVTEYFDQAFEELHGLGNVAKATPLIIIEIPNKVRRGDI